MVTKNSTKTGLVTDTSRELLFWLTRRASSYLVLDANIFHWEQEVDECNENRIGFKSYRELYRFVHISLSSYKNYKNFRSNGFFLLPVRSQCALLQSLDIIVS